ncbi:hypothetical protein ACWDWU_03430 [Streptomyces sp. NPDC003442]
MATGRGGRPGEKAGRLKPNGRLRRRSGLSTVLELESPRIGVEGKALHKGAAATMFGPGRTEPREAVAGTWPWPEHDSLRSLHSRHSSLGRWQRLLPPVMGSPLGQGVLRAL